MTKLNLVTSLFFSLQTDVLEILVMPFLVEQPVSQSASRVGLSLYTGKRVQASQVLSTTQSCFVIIIIKLN